MKQHFMTAIGVAAFVIGGIIARDKALEIAETVEKTFSKKPDPETTEQ